MRRLLLAGGALTLLAGCGSAPGAGIHLPRDPVTASAPAQQRTRPTTMVASVASWKLPTPISREAVLPYSHGRYDVLVAGGMPQDQSSSGMAYGVALNYGKVADLPSLAVPVHDAAAGLFHGRPAVYGGGNSSEQSVVQRLDGGSWTVVGQMPTTRSDLSVAEVKGTTYVLGGYDGSGQPTDVLKQRGGSPVTTAGSLQSGVRYAAVAVLHQRIYLFGGEVDNAELTAVQRYDPATGVTAVVAHLPRGLGHAMAATVGGRILVMGGRVGPDTQTRAMRWFDPRTDKFSKAGKLPAALSDAGVATSGSRVYLLGGEHQGGIVTDQVVQVAPAG